MFFFSGKAVIGKSPVGCSWDFFRGEYPPTSLSGLGRHESGGIISHLYIGSKYRVYNIGSITKV